MSAPLTPSQTVGPYLSIGMAWPGSERAVAPGHPEAIRVYGRVLDGDGSPVPDGAVELWSPGTGAFTRSLTDDHGAWHAVLPRPRPVSGHAPHLAVTVFGRGLLRHLVTRAYLGPQLVSDPVLDLVPAERRATLLAEHTDDGHRFDIRLQGSDETVFFDV